jgi:hypothetical protein
MICRQQTLATILFLIVVAAISVQAADSTAARVIIQGTVLDADSLKPIGFATIRVEGTGHSTLANEDGRYRLVLSGPTHRRLTFRPRIR